MILTAVLVALASQDPAPPPPPPPMPHANAPAFEMSGNALVLPKPIAFAAGTATLRAGENDDSLGHIAAFLSIRSFVSTMRIEAHAAERTPAAQALSEKRALAVARALVARGVDCRRLVAVGFGGTKPVAEAGSAQNTRVVAVVAALRGRAIEGAPLDGGGKSAGDVCETPKAP